MPKIYKNAQFKKFIKSLSSSSIPHWSNIAEAIGVSNDTITRWKDLPEAQKAIQEGIDYAMAQMERSGKSDWRMWKEKLAMLKVAATERVDVTSGGEKLELVIKEEDNGGISKQDQESGG